MHVIIQFIRHCYDSIFAPILPCVEGGGGDNHEGDGLIPLTRRGDSYSPRCWLGRFSVISIPIAPASKAVCFVIVTKKRATCSLPSSGSLIMVVLHFGMGFFQDGLEIGFEALACGCPVVATDCPGGLAEILEKGRYGRLVPAGDASALATALETLMRDPDRAAAMGRRARDYVASHFSIEAEAQKIAAVYERALGRKTAPAPPDDARD